MPKTRQKRKITKQNTTPKLRESIKLLRKKLSETTASFKERLQAAEAAAYTRAVQDITKKAAAKMKALAVAEAKFEKHYSKKSSKKSPSTISTPTAKSRRGKKRGRPANKD